MIFYKIKRSLKEEYSVIISLVLVIFISLLFIVALKKYIEVSEEVNNLQSEVDILNRRADILKNNKGLLGDNIDEANKLLSVLIPDHEDFFSLISAIESIALRSGILVEEYDVNLGQTSKEKISINVKFRGDADSFVKFLNDYHFAGGRLITIEKIDFASKISTSNVTLNFYNKKIIAGADSDSEKVSKFTTNDIEELNKIKEKVNFTLSAEKASSSAATSTTYESKDNPF